MVVKDNPKILITVPRLSLLGGVSNYYKILRPCLDADKEYFEIGSKPGEKSIISSLLRLVSDYYGFHKKLLAGDYQLVHINPSLGLNSVVRDGLLILIARYNRISVLVFFRGWDSGFEKLIRRYYLPIFRMVYGLADGFIVLANEFKQTLKKWGIKAPVFFATTVVADSVFADSCSGNSSYKKRKGSLTILYLSRLEKEKGVYEAIDAYALLKEKYPDVTLIVAGDGEELLRVQDYVAQRGLLDIEFSGFIDGEKKHQVYLDSDIYLFPTTYGEGMPNSVLEAMAYGLPVITRPVGGLRDFFENGRMGYVTDSSEPFVFMEFLEKLVVDSGLRDKMGQYNRSYAKGHFSATKVAARLESIYEKLLGHGIGK